MKTLFIIIIIIIFTFIAYYRSTQFWAIQPVFHLYNVSYLFSKPHIIRPTQSATNRYTDLINVNTTTLEKSNPVQLQRIGHFIQTHYMHRINGNRFFPLLKEHIIPYFSENSSMVSTYSKGKGELTGSGELTGLITSRPLIVLFPKKGGTMTMNVMYVDYLCTHGSHRKRGIAAKLIQTHEYRQCRNLPSIQVSLFKREDELTGIVPICAYSTYGFYIQSSLKYPLLSPEYFINKETMHSMHEWMDFFTMTVSAFDVCIYPPIANLMELVKTHNIWIYSLFHASDKNNRLCTYLFRQTRTFINKNNQVLQLFASICSSNVTDASFSNGAMAAIADIIKHNASMNFGCVAIESISHNDVIISGMREMAGNPAIVSPCAYFWYNYAMPTVASNRAFIIN